MAASKKNPKTNRKFFERTATKSMGRVRRQGKAGHKNLDYMKPPKFRDYLTRSEVAVFVPVDPSWLNRLEAQGRIPKAHRVKMGKITIRLWSPQQAEEIKSIIEGHRVGRPTKNS